MLEEEEEEEEEDALPKGAQREPSSPHWSLGSQYDAVQSRNAEGGVRYHWARARNARLYLGLAGLASKVIERKSVSTISSKARMEERVFSGVDSDSRDDINRNEDSEDVRRASPPRRAHKTRLDVHAPS